MSYYVYMKFNGQLLQGVLQNSREQAIAYACKSFDNWMSQGLIRQVIEGATALHATG